MSHEFSSPTKVSRVAFAFAAALSTLVGVAVIEGLAGQSSAPGVQMASASAGAARA